MTNTKQFTEQEMRDMEKCLNQTDETYQKGGEGMKKMSAIAMVRFCETADDWISMICNQCKIRRPSKASYWFNVCEAVFESLKSRPLRNCDKYRTLEEAEAAWNRLTMGDRLKYRFFIDKWLYDEANE